MQRRTFIASVVPPLVLSRMSAQTPQSATAFVVRSGEDRQGGGLALAGRTPTQRKIRTQDSAAALLLFEHRDMGTGGPARHVHFEQDEWFYAVKGAFDVEVGGEMFRLNPGDLVFAPRNVPHSWACVSEMPGTILIGLYPALTFERFLERLGALGKPLEGDALAKLFEDHGMKIVGPPLERR